MNLTSGRKRGDLGISLTSPKKTTSTLLHQRRYDGSTSGYIDWPFMTTHSWGEDPNGQWILSIVNDAISDYSKAATILGWSLEIYGIDNDPNDHIRNNCNNHSVNGASANASVQDKKYLSLSLQLFCFVAVTIKYT